MTALTTHRGPRDPHLILAERPDPELLRSAHRQAARSGERLRILQYYKPMASGTDSAGSHMALAQRAESKARQRLRSALSRAQVPMEEVQLELLASPPPLVMWWRSMKTSRAWAGARQNHDLKVLSY